MSDISTRANKIDGRVKQRRGCMRAERYINRGANDSGIIELDQSTNNACIRLPSRSVTVSNNATDPYPSAVT